MSEKIITLDNPLKINDETYTEIKLREPTVNEVILSLKVAGKRTTLEASYESNINLLHRVSGLPGNVIEALPGSVMDEATNYLFSFQEEQKDNSCEELIEINPPIVLSNKEEYDFLELKEPTVGQRKKATRALDQYGNTTLGGMEFQVSLLTEVTGWKLAAVLKLPMSIFMQASQYFTRFFPNGQETGVNLGAN